MVEDRAPAPGLGVSSVEQRRERVSQIVDATVWSSQGLVETLSKRLMSGFELLRTDAAEMTVTAR
jgi:hypothetical protein